MTDAKEEGLWDYLEIYCATTKTDNLGITALSISYYEEMFRNPSEFDISLKKKKGWHFSRCSVSLCRGFSSIREWKRSRELVWGESNASWQWIVPIDWPRWITSSTQSPSRALLLFLHVWDASIYILPCWNAVNPCVFFSAISSGRKIPRSICMTLIEGDWSLKVRQKAVGKEGQRLCWLMKQRLRRRQQTNRYVAALTSDPTH